MARQTIRELIVSAIGRKLEAVRIANDYRTDCGLNVLRGRENLEFTLEIPCIVFWPETETVVHKGRVYCTMPVKVEAFGLYGDENPSVVSERMLGDIIRAMTERATIADTTGGYGDDVEYASGGPSVLPDAETLTVGAFATFNVLYKTKAGDPYSQ